MSTKNPRVAGYIPPDIHDRFKSFKEERGIKGDSQGLAVMMAEFFGVPHQVAQGVDYSLFVTQTQFNELVAKVSELAKRVESGGSDDESLGRLPNKMRQIAERLDKVEAFTSLLPSAEASPASDKVSTTAPGQMDFLDVVQGSPPSDLNYESPKSDSGGELESEPPGDEQWMSTKECWEYLGKPGPYATFRKASPEKLHQLYGVKASLEKKAEEKYNAKWLNPPVLSTVSDQVSQENQGELPEEF